MKSLPQHTPNFFHELQAQRRLSHRKKAATTDPYAGLRYHPGKEINRHALKDEIEDRARDAGFASEAEHQRWRQLHGIEGPTIRTR